MLLGLLLFLGHVPWAYAFTIIVLNTVHVFCFSTHSGIYLTHLSSL